MTDELSTWNEVRRLEVVAHELHDVRDAMQSLRDEVYWLTRTHCCGA